MSPRRCRQRQPCRLVSTETVSAAAAPRAAENPRRSSRRRRLVRDAGDDGCRGFDDGRCRRQGTLFSLTLRISALGKTDALPMASMVSLQTCGPWQLCPEGALRGQESRPKGASVSPVSLVAVQLVTGASAHTCMCWTNVLCNRSVHVPSVVRISGSPCALCSPEGRCVRGL